MPASDDALPIAHSILSAEGVARLVKRHHDFGPVSGCRLLRSGYNEVYALDGADGTRRIARLGALRARGPANIDYEIAMLAHVAARGAVVAEPIRPRSGSAGVAVAMPEGSRWLTLFSRRHRWVSEAFPSPWLRKQLDLLERWRSLGTTVP